MIAKLSICKPGSSSLLIIIEIHTSLQKVECRDLYARVIHGVSRKLYFNLVFTMQTYKELITELIMFPLSLLPYRGVFLYIARERLIAVEGKKLTW